MPGRQLFRVPRQRLPFRRVNRRGDPDYQQGMQRHHLLPRQLISQRCFGALFDAVGWDRLGFEDFRRNGLLLPCDAEAAVRIGLPLHRGPHRAYNGLVAERVGQIEDSWARQRRAIPERAIDQAFMRLNLLQSALRRRLLSADWPRRRMSPAVALNPTLDFSELDAMADILWAETDPMRA